MASRKKENNKAQRVKLYKKVRYTSSWSSVVFYLLMLLIFVAVSVFLGGFILEYIFESKFADGYSKMKNIAELYETGNDNKTVMNYIRSHGNEFIIKDKVGNIVYQEGKNTCSDKSGEFETSNGKETYTVYADSELGYIYPDHDGGLSFEFKKLYNWLSSSHEDDKLPIWVSKEINNGENVFIGKIYFVITSREVALVVELSIGVIIIISVFFVIMLIRIIKSAVSYKRVFRLFYSDPVTNGHNWMWFVRYGEEKLRSNSCKKDRFAVINLVFRNYRNYCMCHSMSQGEKLLEKINTVLTYELAKPEMCAHSTMSNFALVLRYDEQNPLLPRLRDIVKKLQDIDSEHSFDFHIGVDLVDPQKNENGKIVKRKDFSIEKAYNNACSARAALGESEQTDIRIFDNKLLEEQRWHDTVHENQWNALNNEEFKVYYQPKYDPRTNTLKGAEALVRWNSAEYGFITPGRFIPIFEKNGFITELDHYMISHVAHDQKAWLDAGYDCVPVSVNVSRAHFAENDLAEQIRDLVDKAGCPHDLIEIELTESAFFDDKKAMIETIKKLKEYGFAVSMDDFGAGYSSLNSLKDMPLDVLKLDADFFRGENAGERGEIVVSEAIKLAKSLDMRTVAEGVEEKGQVDFLAQQGCDMIQGFYFAKPMPKDEYAGKMDHKQQ